MRVRVLRWADRPDPEKRVRLAGAGTWRDLDLTEAETEALIGQAEALGVTVRVLDRRPAGEVR